MGWMKGGIETPSCWALDNAAIMIWLIKNIELTIMIRNIGNQESSQNHDTLKPGFQMALQSENRTI